MTSMKGLRPLDSLGSVRAVDAPIEAICWTHRGGGWDVHSTLDASQGAAVRTKREAYALVRRMRDEYHKADKARENNDSRYWA
jgi:hypothetical protein